MAQAAEPKQHAAVLPREMIAPIADHQGLSSENKIPTRAVQAEDRTTTKFTSNLHEKTSQSSCTGYHCQVDAQYDEEVWHRHKHLQGPFCKSSRCGGVQKKRDVP